MNTIEQAREFSKALRIRSAYGSEARQAVDTIDALLAELAALSLDLHTETAAVIALRAELDTIKSQKPVDAVLLEDMVEGSHPQYGRGLFATDNCVKGVYLSAGAQPAQQSPRFNFEVLHKFAEDNRISYNGMCAAVKESLLAAPAQEQQK